METALLWAQAHLVHQGVVQQIDASLADDFDLFPSGCVVERAWRLIGGLCENLNGRVAPWAQIRVQARLVACLAQSQQGSQRR